MSAPLAPQNLDAEEKVLGAILAAGAGGPEASAATVAKITATGLTPDDFYYRERNGLIYEAALRVVSRGEPTEASMVEQELRSRGEIERAGGRSWLHELAVLVPATANAAHFAGLVVEAADRREAFEVGRDIQVAAQNGSIASDPELCERIARLPESRQAGRGEREHSWQPLDLIDLGSREPEPPDIGGLFYSGKRAVVSGEDDAGKTMLLAGISADELRADRGVIWIDTDEMGASAVLERLRAFGADDEAIRRQFAYLQPEEALTDAARDDVIALIRERSARLVVSDAFNAALTLHGYSPHKTEDVETFWQRVVAPFCRVGAGVVLPDHVVKKADERGRYAYGSERKATGCDVHLGLRVIEPFGRGRRGKAKISVHRDRIGFLEKPGRKVFVLDSDPATGRLAWRIEQDDEAKVRPTRLMEKVSDYLERSGEPCPRNRIEQDVKGKTDFKRLALDLLIREGYAAEFSGDRGARLVEHVRPFREADEWAES